MSKWLYILIFFVLLILLFGFFGYEERKSYKCEDCYSKKSDYQWHLGTWMGTSTPITGTRTKISPSKFQQDFFDSDHTHNWKFSQGSPYYFFGKAWGGCMLGSGRMRNKFIDAYERDEIFRLIVLSELDKGSISKPDILTALSLDKNYMLDAPTSKVLHLLMTKHGID